MYRHSDASNFHSFTAATRTGNPESIVAFNLGIGLLAFTDAEDYTAGKTNEPQNFGCRGRWPEGKNGHREQWHLWSFLGEFWTRKFHQLAGANTHRLPAGHRRGSIKQP